MLINNLREKNPKSPTLTSFAKVFVPSSFWSIEPKILIFCITYLDRVVTTAASDYNLSYLS